MCHSEERSDEESLFLLAISAERFLAPPRREASVRALGITAGKAFFRKPFNRAVKGGARVDMPVENLFWGDRYGTFTDPFGQQWGIATHVEDVSPEEMSRRQQAFFARAAGQN
jgi:hypothetical protein